MSTTQRGDLAAYIAGLAAPAPALTYAPSGGAVFPATVAGATSAAVVTISNTGTADLVFAVNNAVSIARGGNAADFRITSSNCHGVTLQPNQGNCTINVTFRPVAAAATRFEPGSIDKFCECAFKRWRRVVAARCADASRCRDHQASRLSLASRGTLPR